ncbi:glycoside hydrolase 43 family protein [Paenibacillus montaniterrae]|uniref:Glycoside hydrolase 43 family protein n=1 Tax=Paenibacillus montaniterrae TaxID=429341 RepID=A0A920CZ48_9BACL|nr:glycoside hydrolase family 43 protein [Paenibacillus montaniterrae]GIP18531.1 glycoside hydrolase 43 family protein [Paenibacillus montaniterrae]
MVKTYTYTNPVLPGFYPDPSAIRVGEDYYMVTSTFEYFPGVPIFHSKDLVNWQQIGHVLHRESQVNLLERQSSQGIYAPVLRYYDGVFYMITTDVYGIGNFYVTATDPAGPWSDPIRIPYGNIDPSLFFDDDGKVYVSAQAGFGDTSHIIQYEINPQTGEALTEPVVVFEGDEGPWVEGPHLYKMNGMYYMMTASGGTGPMHREIIGRSSSPYGPFDMLEHPILTHNALHDHPLQYTGHAELVDDVDGNWWALFLGVRLRNERGSVLGRETYLAPVAWVDGWPMIDNNEGHVGLQMEVTVPSKSAADQVIVQHEQPRQVVTTFSSQQPLGLEWIYTRVLPTEDAVSLDANEGYLTLVGNSKSLHDGHNTVYVCRRQLHHVMRIETKLSYLPQQNGEAAGIAARLSDHSYYAIGLTKQEGKLGVQATLMRNKQAERAFAAIDEAAFASKNELQLAIEATEQNYTLLYSLDGESWELLASAPASGISPDADGSFTGVTVGMYAHGTTEHSSAPARFASFKYESL